MDYEVARYENLIALLQETCSVDVVERQFCDTFS